MILRPLIFFCLAIVSHAGESAPSELVRLRQSLDSATTQHDLNIASGELAKYWDRELVKEESKLLEAFDPEHAELFRTAQKAWREFRSAETKLHGAANRDGSIQPLIYNTTYAAITEQRLKELRAMIGNIPIAP